jgi:prepilin-type N-terminal cleavage/methylation domain-containing protein
MVSYINLKMKLRVGRGMVNQRGRGFTLIELLAVIVVLAIILSIAVPAISNIIDSSTRSAFESDAKMVLKAVKYKKLENESFDETTVNKDNINTLLGLSAANYNSLSIIKNNGTLTLRIVGASKWNGYIACGTEHSMNIVNSINECGSDKVKPVIIINGNSSITINLNSTYTDAGATASDDMDGDITSKIVTSGSVNTAVEGTYTITYTVSDISGNMVSSTRTVEVLKTVYTYSYMPSSQEITIGRTGTYKIELWGAEGGSGATTVLAAFNTSNGIFKGGRGAYTSGYIYLTAGEKIYAFVGGKGTDHAKGVNSTVAGGYNGGGTGARDTLNSDTFGGAGGGATDVRLINGTWNNADSLKSRIMVAAGGGGGAIVGTSYSYNDTNRCGTATMGGETSVSGIINSYNYGSTSVTNVTQTSGYQFGVGAAGINGGECGGGGGGGYYGGTVYNNTHSEAGAGGSSFISGYIGCNAIDAAGTHTGQPNHYSGKVFTDMIMKSGNDSMPTYDGTSTVVGNNGNGYAKITFIGA